MSSTTVAQFFRSRSSKMRVANVATLPMWLAIVVCTFDSMFAAESPGSILLITAKNTRHCSPVPTPTPETSWDCTGDFFIYMAGIDDAWNVDAGEGVCTWTIGEKIGGPPYKGASYCIRKEKDASPPSHPATGKWPSRVRLMTEIPKMKTAPSAAITAESHYGSLSGQYKLKSLSTGSGIWDKYPIYQNTVSRSVGAVTHGAAPPHPIACWHESALQRLLPNSGHSLVPLQ